MQVVQCVNCKFQQPEPLYVCPECGGQQLQTVETPDSGSVYSFTIIHVAPQAFQPEAPYTVVIVTMKGGFKVTGRLKERRPIQIGDTVMCTRFDEGGYWFEKIGN